MSTSDRRTAPRIPFVCDIRYAREGVWFSRRSSDLSATGIYLEDSSPPPVGTIVEVEFMLEDCTIRSPGHVATSHPPIGFGVALVLAEDWERELLSRYVTSRSALVGV